MEGRGRVKVKVGVEVRISGRDDIGEGPGSDGCEG